MMKYPNKQEEEIIEELDSLYEELDLVERRIWTSAMEIRSSIISIRDKLRHKIDCLPQ
jgi:hypothetical protein